MILFSDTFVKKCNEMWPLVKSKYFQGFFKHRFQDSTQHVGLTDLRPNRNVPNMS